MRGHVRRRGRSWQAIAYAGRDPDTGRKRYASRTASTKRGAEAKLAELLREVGEGQHAGRDAPFSELLLAWRQASAPRWSPRWQQTVRQTCEGYLTPALGAIALRKLRTVDFDRLYADLQTGKRSLSGKPLSPASVRLVHSVARRALEQAIRWGWLERNPAARASVPTVHRSGVRAPSPDEVAAILEAVESQDDALFLRLAAVSGARAGELCALRWSSVEPEGLIISASIALGDAGPVEKRTKTHAERRVPLDAGTLAELAAHRRRCAQRALACGVPLAPDAYVFSLEPDGSRPWRPDLASHRFARARRRAGVDPTVHLHSLRHFAATRMLAAGFDPAVGAARLGHRSTKVFLDVYSHAVEGRAREAADYLGSLMPERRVQ